MVAPRLNSNSNGSSLFRRRRNYLTLGISVALFVVWLCLVPLQESGQLHHLQVGTLPAEYYFGGLGLGLGLGLGAEIEGGKQAVASRDHKEKEVITPQAPLKKAHTVNVAHTAHEDEVPVQPNPAKKTGTGTHSNEQNTASNRKSATDAKPKKKKPKKKNVATKNDAGQHQPKPKAALQTSGTAATSTSIASQNTASALPTTTSLNPLFFPGPPKKFLPQAFDPDGVPNVVQGCGGRTETANGTSTLTSSPHVDRIQIQIHVLVEQVDSLQSKRFWKELQDADYDDWNREIPLYIHQINNTGSSFALFEWRHGPKHMIESNPTPTGANVNVNVNVNANANTNATQHSLWLKSLGNVAKQVGNNTLLVTFHLRGPSDIQLSPLYFHYLQQLIQQYASHPRCQDWNLMGFALTSLFDGSPSSLGEGRSHHSAFLSVLPSIDAAAVWSDQYSAFFEFAQRRRHHLQSNPNAATVPVGAEKMTSISTSDSEEGKRLWTEFAFGRGLVMMYPNLAGHQQLACTYSACTPSQLSNSSFVLPPYGDLAVLDANLKLTTKEVLVAAGTQHLNSLAKHCQDDCQDLMKHWGRPGWSNPTVWKDNNPLLCIADAYSSVDLMSKHSKQPIAPNETRYLLFEPQFGTNNQIHAIMEGYYWAKLLGRQLVIPPILTPRVSHFFDKDINDRSHWVDFRKFYRLLPFDDPKNLFGDTVKVFPGHDLPPISFEEFEALKLRPWRLLRLTRHTPFDPSARLLSQSMGMPTDNEVVNLRHLFNGVVPIDRVQHLLGGCNADQVLFFDNSFFLALKEAEPRSRMKDTLELSGTVQEHIHTIQQVLYKELGSTNFTCYHVRQGDFTRMCNGIENPANGTEVSTWLKMTAREFQCFVGNDDLKLELLDDPRPALVMSDNPGALQDAIDASSTPTVTSQFIYNVTKATSQMKGTDLDILSLIVDQTLCAASDLAVLNKFSTVSQRVAKMRQEKGVRYWRKSKTE